MNEMLNSKYNFLHRETDVDLDKLVHFVNTISFELKTQFANSGILREKTEDGHPIKYNPIDYWDNYNIFTYQNEQLYDLLQYIKSMTQEMCQRLNLDYDEQKYHVHGWINRYTGELNDLEKDRLPWHNHGPESDHFHGVFAVDAEPSVTHYRIDGKEMDLEQKNGQVVLLTNYEHTHGHWYKEKPRITLAFNVKPVNNLPYTKKVYIPL